MLEPCLLIHTSRQQSQPALKFLYVLTACSAAVENNTYCLRSVGYIVYLVFISISAAAMFLIYRHGKLKQA